VVWARAGATARKRGRLGERGAGRKPGKTAFGFAPVAALTQPDAGFQPASRPGSLLRFVSVYSVSPFVNSVTSATSETSLPPLGGKLVQRSRRECAVLRHGEVAQRERLS